MPNLSPSHYIAFLRAINVGGHTVKMERLRTLFEELGYTNVQTFIASGNVIFDTPDHDANALQKAIETHLQQSLGYAVATFLRTPAELADVALYEPFDASEIAKGVFLYVAFLASLPGAEAQKKLMAFRNEINDFQIHNREVYWLCRKNLSESSFSGALLEKTLGMPATIRNITTVRKLAAKYPATQ